MKTSLKSFAMLVVKVGVLGMGTVRTALAAVNSIKEVASEVLNAATVKCLIFRIVNSWKP